MRKANSLILLASEKKSESLLLRQDTNPEVLVTLGFFFISLVNQALSALNYSHAFLKNRQIAPHFAT